LGVITFEKQPVERSRRLNLRLFNDAAVNADAMHQWMKYKDHHGCLAGKISEEGSYDLRESTTLVFT
jgi:hypothetical protein